MLEKNESCQRAQHAEPLPVWRGRVLSDLRRKDLYEDRIHPEEERRHSREDEDRATQGQNGEGQE